MTPTPDDVAAMVNNDECEWNPVQDRYKISTDTDHNVPAAILVGADGDWRLCLHCATLPRFDRYLVRKPIRSKSTPGASHAER